MVLLDDYSKWLEALVMRSTTSASTIEKLRIIFARYGLPEVLVTDNSPQLVSDEFEEFLRTQNIHHVTTPPYHAASNGLAELAVQTVKKNLAKQVLEEETGKLRSVQHRLANFVLHYLSTPDPSTGTPPALLFLGRLPRTPRCCPFSSQCMLNMNNVNGKFRRLRTG